MCMRIQTRPSQPIRNTRLTFCNPGEHTACSGSITVGRWCRWCHGPSTSTSTGTRTSTVSGAQRYPKHAAWRCANARSNKEDGVGHLGNKAARNMRMHAVMADAALAADPHSRLAQSPTPQPHTHPPHTSAPLLPPPSQPHMSMRIQTRLSHHMRKTRLTRYNPG